MSRDASTETRRRVLAPHFMVGGNVDPENVEIVSRCRDLVRALRFDATSLPIDEITFEPRVDGLSLVVDIRVPDRDAGGVEWIHVWRTLLCPWGVLRSNGPEYIVLWLRETIANTLAHEVDETISLHGQRVFDPHRELVPRRSP